MLKNLYVNSEYKFIDRRKVHKLVGSLKKELGFGISSLIINFINKDEIHQINKEYLKHDYTTDIITFNYSGSQTELDGEIFISLDDAAFNAKKYKVSLSEELSRLVIHGILHLTGYDDTTKKDKIIMKRIENNLLNRNKFISLIENSDKN